MIKTLFYLAIIFLIYSCSIFEQNKELIIGQWKSEEQYSILGGKITFYSNGNLHLSPGIFNLKEGQKHPHIKDYVTDIADYKLIDDSLFISTSVDSLVKINAMIEFLNRGELVLRVGDSIQCYKKVEIEPSSNSNKITKLVYTSIGYAPDAIDFAVDMNGYVIYDYIQFAPNNIMYDNRGKNIFVEHIFNNAELLNINKINASLKYPLGSHSRYEILFISDSVIVGDLDLVEFYSIPEYSNILFPLLLSTTFINKRIENPRKISSRFSGLSMHSFVTYSGKHSAKITYLQSFFLLTELHNAEEINSNRVFTYSVSFDEGGQIFTKDWHNIKSIQTDGRYFNFNLDNEESVIFDIGFNYITNNYSQNDFK